METEQKKGRTIVNLKKLGTILLVMSALVIIVAACDSDDPVATKEGVAVESTPTVETPGQVPATPIAEPVVSTVCVEKLAEVVSEGIDLLMINSIFDPIEQAERLSQDVLPKLN